MSKSQNSWQETVFKKRWEPLPTRWTRQKGRCIICFISRLCWQKFVNRQTRREHLPRCSKVPLIPPQFVSPGRTTILQLEIVILLLHTCCSVIINSRVKCWHMHHNIWTRASTLAYTQARWHIRCTRRISGKNLSKTAELRFIFVVPVYDF